MSLNSYDSIAGTGCIAALEQQLAAYVGARFAVAMTNCTSALQAALLACNVRRGDEVIVPAYTWGGSIAGLLSLGAIPVFADIDQTLTLAPAEAARQITRKTKAIIAVHLFGHPCDVAALSTLCHQYNLALIEDCAQAFGATVAGKSVGSFGIGCFSFSAAKQLDVGEGGMLTTDSEAVFDRVLYYTQHPLRQRNAMHVLCEANEFALNFRMHPLTAAALLRRFPAALRNLRQRQSFFTSLNQAIHRAALPGLLPVSLYDEVQHAWHKCSPALASNLSPRQAQAVAAFFSDYGYHQEQGYIAQPLTAHRTLHQYLSRRAAQRVKQITLPRTLEACATRIGVRCAQ